MKETILVLKNGKLVQDTKGNRIHAAALLGKKSKHIMTNPKEKAENSGNVKKDVVNKVNPQFGFKYC